MMETPFFGGTYTSYSPNLADNFCMNLIPELVETKEGKQIGGFYSTPGQRLIQSLPNSGTGYVAGPMRGVHAATNKTLVAVFGNQVVQIDQNQNVTPLGHLNTASGPVSIIDNGSQYAVFDYFQGWSWSGSVWAQITTLPNFPGSATQQDGFGVVGIWGTNEFYQSNLDDLTTWDPLNFSSADADASNLQAVISLYRQLWLVKEKSIEIWNNAGLNGFVFQRMEGAFMNVGCAAPASVATSEDHVFWLGQSDKGSLVVYMNNGYTEVRISTHAVEYALQSYLSLSSIGVADALGFCYTQAGHTYYVLTFPAANHTWVYDFTTRLWHERGEFINGSYERWDPSCYAYFAKQHIVGSSTFQRICQLDITYPTDDLATTPPSNPKRWARRWRALTKPIKNTVRFPALQIDMQTGAFLGTTKLDNLVINGSYANVTINVPYVSNLSIVGGDGTYSNPRVTSGSLPTGLSLSVTGNNLTLSGTVTGTPEMVSFTVAVDSGDGETAYSNQTLTILFTPAVWDPSTLGPNIQLLNSNQRAQGLGTGAHGNVKSTNSLYGKMYFEMEFDNGSGINYADIMIAGLGDATLINTAAPGDNNSTAFSLATESVYQNSSKIVTGSGSVLGLLRVGFAINVATRNVWIRPEGSGYIGGGDPVAGTSPTGTVPGTSLIYACAEPLQSDCYIDLISIASNMTGVVPSGYIAGI